MSARNDVFRMKLNIVLKSLTIIKNPVQAYMSTGEWVMGA